MRSIYILTLITVSNVCFSQNFSQREINKLYSFKIDVNAFDPNAINDYMDLSTILEKDRKWKLNKITGIVFASVSAIFVVPAIWIMSTRTGAYDRHSAFAYMDITLSVTAGVFAGISVPLFISSKRRKKERDVLIKRINN